jgi:FkbM family methyltransferase
MCIYHFVIKYYFANNILICKINNITLVKKEKMIIFDVGANNGSDSHHFSNDPNNLVYAFEPTPELVNNHLIHLAKPNYIIVQKAIGNYCGLVDFFVAGSHDWGCSSIYHFNDNLETTWQGRKDFYVTHSYQVEMITMEKFIDENPHIQQIDYMHCDTQGNDLNVLIGFGKHIDKLKKGVIEVFAKNPLYKNINNSFENTEKFLQENNFKILGIYPNDSYNNELNILFENI